MRNRMSIIALVLLSACVTTSPKIRTDYDRAANFASYRTWNFAPELGTDRAGYSTLITAHFRTAVSREMLARGYVLSDENPDLIVNFFTSVRERTRVVASPEVTIGTGYYSYRYGLYTTWPLYGRDVTTTTYRIGTASIDVVDAARRQLVWEGVAEGRLTDRIVDNPGPAISAAVADIFARYPARAGSAASP